MPPYKATVHSEQKVSVFAGLSLCSRFVYLQLFQQLGWEQVAALTEDGQKYTEYISHMQDLLQASGITFVVNRKFPRDRAKASMFKVQYVYIHFQLPD
jgi:hypothetical protein